MVQSKRQKAIIIDIKNRIERGKKRKHQLLTNPSDFEKSSKIHFNHEIRSVDARNKFLNKKLAEAESGKPVFKKDLSTSAQLLQGFGVAEQGRF